MFKIWSEIDIATQASIKFNYDLRLYPWSPVFIFFFCLQDDLIFPGILNFSWDYFNNIRYNGICIIY